MSDTLYGTTRMQLRELACPTATTRRSTRGGPAREIREYVELGDEYDAEILMSVGTRANCDIGGSVQTAEGARIGYRLRGQKQIVRAIEDVKCAIDLGVRGFVVYDEGPAMGARAPANRGRSAGRHPPEGLSPLRARQLAYF